MTCFFKPLFAALLIMTGCTGKQESVSSSSSQSGKVVNLFIWSNYLSPSVLDQFQKQTGIRVQVSNFSSNEELLAKLQAGATGYDVIMPSDYMVAVMVKLGLLRELDRKLVPNMNQLDSFARGRAYDPENKFSAPFGWTTTGIAVNRERFTGKITGWHDLLTSPELNGQFSLLDDVREVMGAALKMNGKSLNATDKEELEAAKQVLMRARARVRSFTSEPKTSLLSGNLSVSQMYSSDAMQAAKASRGKIEFILPSEGAAFAIDNLAVPQTAPHPAEAFALINFLLTAQINAKVVQERWVGSVIKGVVDLLPQDLKQNKAIVLDPKLHANWEMVRDIGAATPLYDRIWTEIKAAN